MASSGARSGVFISHAHQDRELAEALADLLRVALELPAAAITCTSDAEHGLQPGGDLGQQIRGRLTTARAVFLLATHAARDRDWVQYESAIADLSSAEDALFYVVTPLRNYAAVVPTPYQNRVIVRLCQAGDVLALLRDLRGRFGAPIGPETAWLDAAAALIDEANAVDCADVQTTHQKADAGERVAHDAAVAERDRLHRTTASFKAVAAMLAVLALGLAWWRVHDVNAYEERLAALADTHAKQLALKDEQRSEAIRDAQLASDDEFRQFSFSGQLQDGRFHKIDCSSVEALVRDHETGKERSVAKPCDAAGMFTFSAPELQNDARVPLKLRIHVRRDAPFEALVRLAEARLAILLQQ